MALNVLNSNMPVAELNKTNIALIPKKKSSTKMTDFRPISLSNVVYKIIAKVLSNKLKAVLPQSAFLTKHLIIDNILVAFEIMHYLNNKREWKRVIWP